MSANESAKFPVLFPVSRELWQRGVRTGLQPPPCSLAISLSRLNLVQNINFAAHNADMGQVDGDHLQDVAVELEWADGSVSQAKLGDEQTNENAVRYLSQKFVEHLCAEDNIGLELVREIENVIFSYLDPTDTLNASSFEELRSIRTEAIRTEGDRLRDDVMRLIREECVLREGAATLPEKKKRITTLTQEQTGLEKQAPKATSVLRTSTGAFSCP